MITTRLSKIARLPKTIREELNHRLENGQLSRTILPWVNELPETKEILAEIFHGNAITHQNLSEWRATGYQDWLFHQDRLQWFSRLEEEDAETSQHDGCADTYEAISRFFIFEVGQAMEAARKIKNPQTRWARVEPIMEKFTRLQNAYNWSRRVGLEYDKYNDIPGTGHPDEIEPPSPEQPEALEETHENGERARPGRSETRPRVSPLDSTLSETVTPANPCSADFQSAVSPTCSRQSVTLASAESTPAPEPEKPDLSATAPVLRSFSEGGLATAETKNPESETPRPTSQQSTINHQLPPKCQPLPTLATTPQLRPQIPERPLPKPSQPPTWKNHKVYSLPIRPRRFRCVEG